MLIRRATLLDLPYVIRTRLLSSLITPIEVARTHSAIESMVGRPSVTVLVAAADDLPDAICAFAIREGPALHYLYVRRRLRRQRLAAELLQALPGLETHTIETPDYRALLQAGVIRTRFQPERSHEIQTSHF